MDDSLAKPTAKVQSHDSLDSTSEQTLSEIGSRNAADNPPLPPRQPVHGIFAPNDHVAGRFKILTFVGHGGMGEVYEAEDLELKEKVALKTVRHRQLANNKAIERFRKEIVVARRVTHPNVCRTFDLFRHASSIQGGKEILVVSMELLRGENLEEWLCRKGPLNTEEAYPLVKQMIAGLQAAHEAGVVHRDFKTSNVMLVVASTGSQVLRAVITDFGLAHSMQEDAASLTSSSDMIGTPAYMAPEQVEGKEITPATDIYSLGVVMFRLVTSQLPFQADTLAATMLKRLQEPAPSPKSLRPGLDDNWSETILKCLEREPAKRFSSVQEVELALTGRRSPGPVLDTKKSLSNLDGMATEDGVSNAMVERDVRITHALPRRSWRRIALILAGAAIFATGARIYSLRTNSSATSRQPTRLELTLQQEEKSLTAERRLDEALTKNQEIVNLHGALAMYAVNRIAAIQNLQRQEASFMTDAKTAENRNDLSRAQYYYQKVIELHGAREGEATASLRIVRLKMSGAADADIAKQDFSSGLAAFRRGDYSIAKTHFDRVLAHSPQNWPQRARAADYERRSANRAEQQQHLNRALSEFTAKNFEAVQSEATRVINTADGDPVLVRQAQDLTTRVPAAPSVVPIAVQPTVSPEVQGMTRDTESLIQQGQYKAAWSRTAAIEQLKGDASLLRQAIRAAEENRFQELSSRHLAASKTNRSELQSLLGAYQLFADNTANKELEARKYVDQITREIAALDTAPANPSAAQPVLTIGPDNDAAAIKQVLNRYAEAVATGDLEKVKAVRQLKGNEEKKMIESLKVTKGKGYAIRNCSNPEITGNNARASCYVVLSELKDIQPAQVTFLLKRIYNQWFILSSN